MTKDDETLKLLVDVAKRICPPSKEFDQLVHSLQQEGADHNRMLQAIVGSIYDWLRWGN